MAELDNTVSVPAPISFSGQITYCSGYKYQLTQTWWVDTEITGYTLSIPGYILLASDGRLTIYAEYAWDGPSGPTIDTPDFMRGSLAHDALYQLMREGHLPISHRDTADRLLVSLCKQDGMSDLRASYIYVALREFAGGAAKCKPRTVYTAGAVPID